MRYLLLCLFVLLLSACNNATLTPVVIPVAPTSQLLPTPFVVDIGQAGTPNLPTATSTLVMNEPWTPTPVPPSTPLPPDVRALVVGVLSPETLSVVLEGDPLNRSYVVRLLGIDAPDNNLTDPWGIVTFETLDRWLTGRVVQLVSDTTTVNDEGELPRYLYWDDTLINVRLVELGLAEANPIAPDLAFASELNAANRDARSNEVGLWGPPPTPTLAQPAIGTGATLTSTLTLSPTAILATPTISTTPTTLSATPTLTATPPLTATAVVP